MQGESRLVVFDFNKIRAYPHEQRDRNVLFMNNDFKVRIIELPPSSEMPRCDMAANVIFYVVKGMAQVTVNEKKETIKKGQCLITETATISMKTQGGVKIIGIQIGKTKEG